MADIIKEHLRGKRMVLHNSFRKWWENRTYDGIDNDHDDNVDDNTDMHQRGHEDTEMPDNHDDADARRETTETSTTQATTTGPAGLTTERHEQTRQRDGGISDDNDNDYEETHRRSHEDTEIPDTHGDVDARRGTMDRGSAPRTTVIAGRTGDKSTQRHGETQQRRHPTTDLPPTLTTTRDGHSRRRPLTEHHQPRHSEEGTPATAEILVAPRKRPLSQITNATSDEESDTTLRQNRRPRQTPETDVSAALVDTDASSDNGDEQRRLERRTDEAVQIVHATINSATTAAASTTAHPTASRDNTAMRPDRLTRATLS